MQKEIIVMGDIEMGAGNLTDDFISDSALSELILSLAKQEHPIDLILNGDTLDFLKCPYIVDGQENFPRHITEDISLTKLQSIYEAHHRVFAAMKVFVKSSPHHFIYFITGNHDHELFFKGVQVKLRGLLGNSKRVVFSGLKYQSHGVHVEHGHQYDFLHKINFKNLFLNYKGKSILNFPWSSFSLMTAFMDLKKKHPFMERITPRPLLFSLHGMVLRRVSLRSIGYFLKSLLYFPFRYYSDPTYTLPDKLFSEFYYRFKNGHWDVDEIIDVFSKKKKDSHYKIFVLGHIHQLKIKKGRKKVVIHPGSWRDEYRLDAQTRMLIPTTKYYVKIVVADNSELQYEVLEYPLQRSVFLFDDVRRDELTYIYLAAHEEGFKLRI